jgi:hypothetical protein
MTRSVFFIKTNVLWYVTSGVYILSLITHQKIRIETWNSWYDYSAIIRYFVVVISASRVCREASLVSLPLCYQQCPLSFCPPGFSKNRRFYKSKTENIWILGREPLDLPYIQWIDFFVSATFSRFCRLPPFLAPVIVVVIAVELTFLFVRGKPPRFFVYFFLFSLKSGFFFRFLAP